MDEERWAAVRGYEGIYEASTWGRIKILVKRQNIRFGSMLAQNPSTDGYLLVRLNRNDGAGRPATRPVSRLVYEAFHGPIAEGIQIDHVNGTKIDNRLSNLEAVTCNENIRRSIDRGGRRGERNGSARLTEEQVESIRARAASGERFGAIARELDVSPVAVAGIAYGRTWKHVGGPICEPRGRIGRPPT